MTVAFINATEKEVKLYTYAGVLERVKQNIEQCILYMVCVSVASEFLSSEVGS